MQDKEKEQESTHGLRVLNAIMGTNVRIILQAHLCLELDDTKRIYGLQCKMVLTIRATLHTLHFGCLTESGNQDVYQMCCLAIFGSTKIVERAICLMTCYSYFS